MMQLEKIFEVMEGSFEQKVAFAANTLEGEVKYWWKEAKRFLEASGTQITWESFQTTFFDTYFLNVLRMKRKIIYLT